MSVSFIVFTTIPVIHAVLKTSRSVFHCIHNTWHCSQLGSINTVCYRTVLAFRPKQGNLIVARRKLSNMHIVWSQNTRELIYLRSVYKEGRLIHRDVFRYTQISLHSLSSAAESHHYMLSCGGKSYPYSLLHYGIWIICYENKIWGLWFSLFLGCWNHVFIVMSRIRSISGPYVRCTHE